MTATRRQFLAATATATTIARAGFGAEPAIKPIRNALKWYMIEEGKTVDEKFAAAKKAGFDCIELDSPNSFELKEVLDARDKHQLPITGIVDSVHWNKPLSDPDPKIRQVGIDGLRRALDDAKAYGATTVLLVPAVVTAKVAYADAYKRSQEQIRQVLPHATSLGVKIALENVWNKFLLSPLEACRYVDEFGSPSIGWHFDIGNIVEYGFPQDWIRTLGKRILKLDVKEYAKPKRFGCKIGEGEIDWKAVCDALVEIGYRGTAAAEINGGGAAHLADTVARMTKVLGPANTALSRR